MTVEVSHASFNPSPNTLSIVNSVCVLCTSEKNTGDSDFAGTRFSESSLPHFHSVVNNDKLNCKWPPVSFLRSAVTFIWGNVSCITLPLSSSLVLEGKAQLSHTSVWVVTLVRQICHRKVTVFVSSTMFTPVCPAHTQPQRRTLKNLQLKCVLIPKTGRFSDSSWRLFTWRKCVSIHICVWECDLWPI